MRAVMLDVPKALLDERRKRGLDRWDEMWEGVLHMVPPPANWHQEFGNELTVVLTPIAKAKGLRPSYETGVFRSDDDYRQPDLVISTPAQRTARGVEGGAELVVEILSPNDESHAKLPFYEAVGVREVLIVNPDARTFEFFVLRGGRMLAALVDDGGRVRSEVLGVWFRTAPGPKLEIVWDAGSASI